MSTQPAEGRVPEWTIAERLYLARTVAGFEKAELADLIGCSRDTVGNYEQRSWPRKRNRAYLKAWALACGVDATWLETGEVVPNGTDPSTYRHEYRNERDIPAIYALAC